MERIFSIGESARNNRVILFFYFPIEHKPLKKKIGKQKTKEIDNLSTFNDFMVDEKIMHALTQMGITIPTEIQEQVIPHAKLDRDLIGQAQTGTGKTAAFGIPTIEKMEEGKSHPQAIVLAPTRELAIQVASELNKLSQFKKAKALAIYGGEPIDRQIKALKKKPEMIVATPGRFMDHMRRKTIRLEDVHVMILDEGDEMLNMGFIEDIETIFQALPTERQTMLFSATMPDRLRRIGERFMNNPKIIKVKSKSMTVDTLEQRYVKVKEDKKLDTLCTLLTKHQPESAIIFGRTKRRVDELTEALRAQGFKAEGLHGDMRQEKRSKVLRQFRQNQIDLLVATDVAARGLDISGVTHVFNFDLPQDTESYVHRVGRTGRAGKKGIAFTFVTPKEMELLSKIEEKTNKEVIKENIPSYEQLAVKGFENTATKIIDEMEGTDLIEAKKVARELLDRYDAEMVLAMALKLSTKTPKEVQNVLTAEAPMRGKKSQNRNSGKKGRPQNRNTRRKPRRP